MSKTICAHLCKSCFALHVCAIQAISEADGTIVVDAEKCIGCGSCNRACVAFGFKALQNKSPASFTKAA
ncbi:4Fe-4S binding domain-containing protein [Desulfacinum hydrothermale DSM 13146]|uniref:4Fe-4S binding domain-containing protein n=1 Tax=Desulfacinum hydrothermale DSM 13146 TaxID=1121390 RepID=A0A1W1XPI3_9BACT|nr:4Fe-4S binding protein [Desulfacinum hydrothermale]SMC25431.1 4Fe-4S binding domain-containing protein [Desulfacinum hydrothermale DSM 13146]